MKITGQKMGNVLFLMLIVFQGLQGARGTSATRKVDIRIFNRSNTPSKEDLERQLANAALTEHGYKKTVVFTRSIDEDTSETQETKVVRYRKSVPCQDMAQVEKEIREKMPGVWGPDVAMKVRKEAVAKREKDAKCEAGIEIHFPSKRCPQNKKQQKREPFRCSNSQTCLLCFALTQQWSTNY